MSRRRASLQLCFRAEGNQHCKPGICFRLTPKTDRKTGDVNPKKPSTTAIEKERSKMPKGKTLTQMDKIDYISISQNEYVYVFWYL